MDSRVDDAVVVSEPIRLEAVDSALPPVHWGAATTTRKAPLLFGVKETWTSVELTTEAVTFCPAAVMVAIAPKVWPELPVCELSTQVCARLAKAPEVEALGERPDHRFSVAVCCVAGLAPVTSMISSSLACGTHAFIVMPPPDSCSTPL